MSAGNGENIAKFGFEVVGEQELTKLEAQFQKLNQAALDSIKVTTKLNEQGKATSQQIVKQVNAYTTLTGSLKAVNGQLKLVGATYVENNKLAEKAAAKTQTEAAANKKRQAQAELALINQQIKARQKAIASEQAGLQQIAAARRGLLNQQIQLIQKKAAVEEAAAKKTLAIQQQQIKAQRAYAKIQRDMATGALKQIDSREKVNHVTGQTVRTINALDASGRKVTATITSMDGKIKNVTTSTNNHQKAVQKLAVSWKGMIRIMTSIAIYRAITRISQGLQQAVIDAAKFQVAIGEIQTIQGGLGVGLDAWQSKLHELSNEFGIGLFDQAEAAYQAMSNQVIKSAEDMSFLTEANKFAVTSVTSTTDAVNLMTASLNAYGQGTEQSEKVAAGLFKTIELGRVRASELGTTYGRVAVLANQLNITQNELNAVLATATIKGVKSSEAMTQFRGVMLALIKPSKAMAALLKSMGVASGEAAIEAYGLNGFLNRLTEATKGQSNEVAKYVRRVRALSGVLALTADGGEKYREVLNQMNTSLGSYGEKQKLVTEKSGFQFNKLINQIKNSFIEMADNGVEAIIYIDKNIISLVSVVKGLTTALVGAGAVLAGLALTNPFTAAIIGGAALAAYIYDLSKEEERRVNDQLKLNQKATDARIRQIQEITDFQTAQIDERTKAAAVEVADTNTLWNQVVDNITGSYEAANKAIVISFDKVAKAHKKSSDEISKAIAQTDKAIIKSAQTLESVRRDIASTLFEETFEISDPTSQVELINQKLIQIDKDRRAAVKAGDADQANELLKDYLKFTKRRIDLDQDQSAKLKSLTDRERDQRIKATKAVLKIDKAIIKERAKGRKADGRKLNDLFTKRRNQIKSNAELLKELNAKQAELDRKDLGKYAANYVQALQKIEEERKKQAKALELAERNRLASLDEQRKKAIKSEQDFAKAYARFKDFDITVALDTAKTKDELDEIFRVRQDDISNVLATGGGALSEKDRQAINDLKISEQTLKNEQAKALVREGALADVRAANAAYKSQLELLSKTLKVDEQQLGNIRKNLAVLRSATDERHEQIALTTALTGQEQPSITNQRGQKSFALDRKKADLFLEELRALDTQNISLDDQKQLALKLEKIAFSSGKLNNKTREAALALAIDLTDLQKQQGKTFLEQQRITEKIRKDEIAKVDAIKDQGKEKKSLNATSKEALSLYDQMIEKQAVLTALTIADADAAERKAEALGVELKKVEKKPVERARGGVIPQKLAGGGIAAYGSDSVPALLSPGEFVMNAASTRRFYSQLVSMNKASPTTYNNGGEVTNFNGGINISLQSAGSTESNVGQIGRALKREIRRGTLKL